MNTSKICILSVLSAPLLTLSMSAQTLLGTFEFTDNSLAATDANAGDGITISNLSLGGGIENDYVADELFSDGDSSANTTADTGLDYISLSRAEVGSNSTSTQLSNARYFSFTVTNNSGAELALKQITASITNIGVANNRYHNARIFNTSSPANITNDTIAQLGKRNGGPDIDTTALLDGTDPNKGSNFASGLTISDGASMTFYIPWVASSNDDSGAINSEYIQIDDLAIYSEDPAPKPTLGTYDFEPGAGGEEFNAKNVASGITFSPLSVNSITGTAVATVDNDGTGMTDGHLTLPGNGTEDDLGNALTNTKYLSFTVTNNSGASITPTTLNFTLAGDNLWKRFLVGVYSSVQGTDSESDDQIALVGPVSPVNAFDLTATVYTIDLTNPTGSNTTPADFTLTNGSSITFYLAIEHPSSSSTRTGKIDNISLETGAPGAPDTTAPAAPTALTAIAGDSNISLDWTDNGEGDLDSYTVYRSETAGSGYSSLASGVASSDYIDNTAVNGTTYYYVVTATDTSTNESANSLEASATPVAVPSIDTDEFTLAVYDFEAGAGGEEFTAKEVATGITMSTLSLGSISGATVEAQATSEAGMIHGNFLSLPGDSGTKRSNSSALSSNALLSFTLTNGTGSDLPLTSLEVTIGGDNVNNGFTGTLYTDIHGNSNAAGHKIATVGEIGSGSFDFTAAVFAAEFHYPNGYLITDPDDFIIPDGDSVTFYLPITHDSTSGSRTGEIDSIHLRTGPAGPAPAPQTMPNILCITTEDMSPNLGCYGDTFATTPNIDTLASKGMLYNYAWSNAPACSPARTTLISGMYASSTGGTAHRDNGGSPAPDFLKYYSLLLQELGYYTTNNTKEDYNLKLASGISKGWHQTKSNSAQWYNRPTKNTPFLAIYNYFETHESRLNNVPEDLSSLKHDPDLVPLAPIYPDVDVIRNQWANHYDKIQSLDNFLQGKLDQLEAYGAAEDTIVLFYSDHGTCAPGGKRYVGNKGNRVPLIVYFPEKWKHLAPPGYPTEIDTSVTSTSDELVSFVDIAPTLLSLAGQPKKTWQHGRAFAGAHYEAPPANDYLFGFTDRMGERTWLTRSVFDGRYVYIRNYRPDQPHLIRTAYQYEQTFLKEWEEMFFYGELSETESKFFMPQGSEELYDLETDPHELTNLINDPSLTAKITELRDAHLAWRSTYGDLAFLVEGLRHEFAEESGLSHWELLGDPTYYPETELFAAADRASLGTAADVPAMLLDLNHTHPSIRHWALIGLMLQGRDTVRANEATILAILNDTNESIYVRSTAAQVLGTHGIDANQTTARDYLFAQSQDNVHGNADMNNEAERKFLKHMQAIDELPFIPDSYETQFDTFEDNSGWTTDYKFHIHRNFYTQYNNPLAAFRHEHGLDRFGADDFYTESGDNVANLFKFAFNLAPNEGDLLTPVNGTMEPGGTSGLPVLFTDAGDGSLKYQFVRRKPAADSSDPDVLPTANMDYTAMTTSDLLGTWDESSDSVAVESIDTEWESVTYTIPGGADSQFYRLDLQQ